MTEFKKYLEQARQEFAYEVGKYNVENNLALRTASDSLLIAFDQATEKALSIHVVMPSDCNYYVSGMDTNMNCVNCKEPKHMH